MKHCAPVPLRQVAWRLRYVIFQRWQEIAAAAEQQLVEGAEEARAPARHCIALAQAA